METTPNEPKMAATKTLAVVGLIAILGMLSFGIIKVAPTIIRGIAAAAVSLTSVFIPAEKLDLTATKYALSNGESFTLSWKTSAETLLDGSYTLSYPCITGLHLEDIAQNKKTVIFCNTTYNFLNTDNTITLAGFNSKKEVLETPVTISFRKNGQSKETSSADVIISVSPSTGSVVVTPTPTTPKPTPTTPATPGTIPGRPSQNVYPIVIGGSTVNNPNGYVDLTGRILGTGVVSTSTNAFLAKDRVKPSERAAVRFEVINNGTKTSRDWNFAVVLPTFPGYIFQSDSQQPLAPGDRIQYTLGFDRIKYEAEGEIRLNIDTTGMNNESNENNNLISGKIYVDLN